MCQAISVKIMHIASVSGRLAGQQAAEDQQYIRQQRTSSTSVSIGPAVLYISQQRTCGTSVSRGPAVHTSAEEQPYISQQRTSST